MAGNVDQDLRQVRGCGCEGDEWAGWRASGSEAGVAVDRGSKAALGVNVGRLNRVLPCVFVGLSWFHDTVSRELSVTAGVSSEIARDGVRYLTNRLNMRISQGKRWFCLYWDSFAMPHSIAYRTRGLVSLAR